jgi:hypothetical protein
MTNPVPDWYVHALTSAARLEGSLTMSTPHERDMSVYIGFAPDPVPTMPRWWYTTDAASLARITFLPDYEPRDGEMVIVGMRAAWDGGDMDLVCDHLTGEYFRKVRRVHITHADRTNTEYGKVFAPAPPPVGLWTGEQPQ